MSDLSRFEGIPPCMQLLQPQYVRWPLERNPGAGYFLRPSSSGRAEG